MMWLSALSGVWKVLKISIPLPLFVILLIAGWLYFDRQSAVRTAVDKAVTELIAGAEIAALEARNAELDRQRRAAELANGNLEAALIAQSVQNAIEQEHLEKEIAAYEARLAAEDRSCPLTPDDIDWLLRP